MGQGVEARPKVLFVVDVPGWAHDFKSTNIARHLADEFDCTIRYQARLSAADVDAADLVLAYYWAQFQNENVFEAVARHKHKLLVGICSHHELHGAARDEGLPFLQSWPLGIFVNNLLLYREYAPLFRQPVFYTPNGVDTGLFSPLPGAAGSPEGTLRIGWAGALDNRDRFNRGYYDFIEPAARRVGGVELVLAAREERWRSHEEMPTFYRGLDVYINATLNDGTPNPCLEAAACGIPLLTTAVGNMPELVVDGSSGLFIERDVDDIAYKLSLLRDNLPLRRAMAQRIRSATLRWDWRIRAEAYRAMFRAALALQPQRSRRGTGGGTTHVLHSQPESPGAPYPADLFVAPEDLYLASADRMDRTLANVADVAARGGRFEVFATVVGGLSGLNYLTAVAPAHCVFFDINLSALRYARLIVDLVLAAEDHEDFIGMVFARPLARFRKATGHATLNVATQQAYLAQPLDQQQLARTLGRLGPDEREVFLRCLGPHLEGKVLDGLRNCRRLLPCWPPDERVPVGAGADCGADEHGALVPNTNSFFLGHGWLASGEAFRGVQQALRRAQRHFLHCDALGQELHALLPGPGPALVHISNIDDWFPTAWEAQVGRWFGDALAEQRALTIATSHNGLTSLAVDPHTWALAGLAPFVFGRVVEVATKVPWGFHEIPRTNLEVGDYLAAPPPAETTILHILVGEGLPRPRFVEACRAALRASRRVLVLEHNARSVDWSDAPRGLFVDEDELTALVAEAARDLPVLLTARVALRGEADGRRNLLFVLDRSDRS